MTNNPETPENNQENQPNPLDKLFESPEVQKGIAEFLKQCPAVLQSWINSSVQKETVRANAQTHSTKWTGGVVLSVTVFVTVIIIAAVSILSWHGKISSEATAFLFGTMIGTVFGIIGRFFGGRG